MPTQADSGGLGFSLSRLLSVGVLLASSSRPSGVIYFVLAITGHSLFNILNTSKATCVFPWIYRVSWDDVTLFSLLS